MNFFSNYEEIKFKNLKLSLEPKDADGEEEAQVYIGKLTAEGLTFKI